MEEEGGDDSEMIDAMENWDSEDQDEEGHKNKKKGEDPVADWDRLISNLITYIIKLCCLYIHKIIYNIYIY